VWDAVLIVLGGTAWASMSARSSGLRLLLSNRFPCSSWWLTLGVGFDPTKFPGAFAGLFRQLPMQWARSSDMPVMPDRSSPHRLGLTITEAAEAVGMSESSFKRHVQPELRIVRRGSLRIIPVAEIERWLEANATLAGGSGLSRMTQTTKRPRAVAPTGGMAHGGGTP